MTCKCSKGAFGPWRREKGRDEFLAGLGGPPGRVWGRGIQRREKMPNNILPY
jgi:hypothetical protein